MQGAKLVILFILGSIIAFVWYFAALADWIQDYKMGVYSHNYTEAALETVALLLYNLAGLVFLRRKINLL